MREVRKFNPNDPRLLGGLTVLDFLGGMVRFAFGAVGGFCFSYLPWLFLPMHVVTLVPVLGTVALSGLVLTTREQARTFGQGWLAGLVLSVMVLTLLLYTAYTW
jgi:hypothetical protein